MTLIRRLLPITLIALCVAGCGDSAGPDVTGPSLTPTAMEAARKDGPRLKELASYRGAPRNRPELAKAWIGPEGGRLELDGFAIDVPAGAVKKDRLFTIRIPVSKRAGKRVVADFGPHGASFEVPVAIEVPYAGTNIEGDPGLTPTIVWWNEDERAWVDMGGTLTADGQRVRTETTHFSLYGLTAKRSGGVTVSGG